MNALIKTKHLTLFLASLMLGEAGVASPVLPMNFNHIALEDGLSQNNVQAIMQDSVGYMWFATESGLNRFDGYDIRQYGRERGNPGGLVNDFIWKIAEDAEQNLWLATQGGGVVRWNRDKDSFTSFRHDPENPNSLTSDDIRTLLINPDGTLWVGTRDKGLNLLNPRTGEAQHFRHEPNDPRSLSNDMTYALYLDAASQLWVGTDGGLNKLAPGTDSFVRFQNDPVNSKSLSDNRVRTIFEDRSGTLWIGTFAGGLNRYDQMNRSFSHLQHDTAVATSLSNNHVRVIFEDDAKRFWIGTADGLNLLDRATGNVHRYHDVAGDPQSLKDNYINSMYQDRGGLLWVGTRSAGVSRWNPRSWSFGHYQQPWLDQADVTSFASDDGTLWVGTLGAGLARIDETSSAIEQFRHRPGDPASISDDRVMSLLLDRDGILWIGTMYSGLNRLDPATGEIRAFRHDAGNPDGLAANGVMALYEDKDANLWIGTYGGGVSVLDKESGVFTHYAHDPDDDSSLSDPRASAILQDELGSIWIGTFGGGLNVLDVENGTFRRFKNDPYDAESLADDTIYALHLDATGSIWVGSAGGGLDRIVFSNGAAEPVRFANTSTQNGLPNNVVYGIQSDSSGLIWLSTNYGVARFDPENSHIKSFHRGHGLQDEEFNFAAHHRAADGKLYFGGANGFNAFYPTEVAEGTHSSNIVMTSLEKLNQPIDADVAVDRLSSIRLGYQDDVVSFAFAALDYTEPSRNTYSYMLEGFDDNWTEAGTKRHFTYTNLDGGQYVLKVKAVTSDGAPTIAGFSLPIEVAPPPWETNAAYLLYAVVVLAILWFVWRRQQHKLQQEAKYSRRLEKDIETRTQQLEQQNVELRIASRAKSNFLARMSHEIRTPMNGMMGMTQLLLSTKLDEKQQRFSQTIKRSAESLLEIINDILDFSKIEAGRLELESVEFNVSELVDETVELFAGQACDKGVELMSSTPPGKAVAAIGDPQRLKQVLVNLIGNAVKFTQDGEIVVSYTLQENEEGYLRFRFEVLDSGIGIQADNLRMIFKSFSQEDSSTSRRFGGTGLGLAICRQLVEMMGGKIGVDSKPGEGSCFWFTVTLPKASPAWLSRHVSFRLANLNVLVVDNNATNRDIVGGYVKALGIEAATAACGVDALKAFNAASQADPFDLVLVDADVGDMSGTHLAQQLKSDAALPPAKIALMTPAATSLDEHEWRQASIDDCLAKPVRQSVLYESILALTAATGAFKARKVSKETEMDNLEPLAGNVLLVEDNPVNQAVALGMLEELGCDTIVAINGKDAIDHIANEDFDVVLMDCEMPVMDGFDATAAIRGQSSGATDIPIIALTANAVGGDRERCIEVGMQDYLSKPISVEKLHGTLKKWLPLEASDTKDTVDPASLDSIRRLKGVGGETMVRRVVELYLSNSAMLIEELRIALSQSNAEAVRQSAHALKASSQNVGAHGIIKLSQKLEALGRSGDLAGAKPIVAELDQLYPKTVSALKAAAQKVQI